MTNSPLMNELRGKDSRELLYDLQEARKSLFNHRIQMASEASKSSSIRDSRRMIARILTILSQRKAADAAAGQATAAPTEVSN